MIESPIDKRIRIKLGIAELKTRLWLDFGLNPYEERVIETTIYVLPGKLNVVKPLKEKKPFALRRHEKSPLSESGGTNG